MRIQSDAVSTRHAQFVREQKTFFVEDLGSTNGTYVNGNLVKKSKVGHSDEISFGDAAFFFKNDEYPLPEEDEEAPRQSRQKKMVLYGGILALAAVAVIAIFAVLDVLETRPGTAMQDGNLLRSNPGFEADPQGERIPGWDLERTGAHEFALDFRAGPDGSAAMRIQSPPEAGPQTQAACRGQEKVKVKEGDVLLFSCDLRSQASRGVAGMRVRWSSESKSPPAEEFADLVTGTIGWMEVKSFLTAPAGAASASVDLVVMGKSGTVWFDNVRVRKAEPGRKGRDKTALSDRRFSAEFTPRGEWSVISEGETKISGGSLSAATASGVRMAGQAACLPAAGYPRSARGYTLRAELVSLSGGYSMPFEQTAEVSEEGMVLAYRVDPTLGFGRGDRICVSFALPQSFARWGFTAVSDGGETSMAFADVKPLRGVKGLVFRDQKDVLKLDLDRQVMLSGRRSGGSLLLVLWFEPGREEITRLIGLKLVWRLPPGRVEARALELLGKAQDHMAAGEMGMAYALFLKVRDEFGELGHLLGPARANIERIEEAGESRRKALEAAAADISAATDAKSMEDLLFKARDFGRKFAGSRFASDAAALQTRALDAYAEKSGSEPFRRHLRLYREACAAYDSEDWAGALRLLTEIGDSLEDTPVVPISQELLDMIGARMRDTAEAEEWSQARFNTSQELEAAGDPARAAEALRGILRRYPKSDWAKKAADEIKRIEKR